MLAWRGAGSEERVVLPFLLPCPPALAGRIYELGVGRAREAAAEVAAAEVAEAW